MSDNPFFSQAEVNALMEDSEEEGKYSLPGFCRQGKPIYLFGCGGFAAGVESLLKSAMLHGYLDNDPAKIGTHVRGLQVFAPGEKAEQIIREKGLVILSLAEEKNALMAGNQCRELGLEYIDWGSCWNNFEKKVAFPELADNKNAFLAYDLFKEAKSRETFRAIVRLRTTLDPNEMPNHLEPQYFVDAIPRKYYRCFVDAGAYDGDTLRFFLTHFEGDFDTYDAFEPLPSCQQRLSFSRNGDSRIVIHPSAVTNFTGRTRIMDQSTSSSIGSHGNIEIDATRLDDAILDRPVTFIKMDVEGEEPAALQGAETMIKTHRPALAISVYHHPSHLWRIPIWIENLNLGYRLLLRHHSRFLTETVCYALPPDRHSTQALHKTCEYDHPLS